MKYFGLFHTVKKCRSITDQLWMDSRAGSGNKRLTTLARFRDTSAWLHIVVMQDTTQSTETNRTKIFVNGDWCYVTNHYTKLYDLLIMSRRKGLINIYSSIKCFL